MTPRYLADIKVSFILIKFKRLVLDYFCAWKEILPMLRFWWINS